MTFFAWLEQTGLSLWIRESPSLWAFPFILYLHTLGLAMLVGVGVAFAIWIMRFAERHPLAPMRQYLPLMWVGFGVNTLSGLLLLIAYPAKALTNPVFYVKLASILIAVGILQWIERRLFAGSASRPPATIGRTVKRLAGATLLLWAVATVAGRLLAYTHSVLLSSDQFY